METTILDRLEFADALVRRIGPERIFLIDSSLSMHPVSRDDGHEIASALLSAGASVVEVHSCPPGIEAHPGVSYTLYDLMVDGHKVSVFASYRTADMAVAS